MLKKIGANSVMSDEGYSMRFERELIIYSEGDHLMHIDRPAGLDGPENSLRNVTYIEQNSINQWLPPYETENIPESKRREILERLKGMICFLGYQYRVI